MKRIKTTVRAEVDQFPLYKELRGCSDIYRHIFYDYLDTETRHICRGVSSTWLRSLPQFIGAKRRNKLCKWAARKGYLTVLASLCTPWDVRALSVDLIAVKRRHTHILQWYHEGTGYLKKEGYPLEMCAIERNDLATLEFLHNIRARTSDCDIFLAAAKKVNFEIMQWLYDRKYRLVLCQSDNLLPSVQMWMREHGATLCDC